MNIGYIKYSTLYIQNDPCGSHTQQKTGEAEHIKFDPWPKKERLYLKRRDTKIQRNSRYHTTKVCSVSCKVFQMKWTVES